MKHKEKFLIYIWLGALVLIILIGVFFCLQRPPAEIIKAGQELSSTADKIRAFYRNRPDYWGLNNTTVIEQKLYEGKIAENKIINNLEKEVIVGGDSEGNTVMPGARSFTIVYRELTQKECVELSAFRGQEQDKLGLIAMSIRNEKGSYDFSWGNKGLPLSKNKAKKYCTEKNEVMWSFE